MRRGIVVVLDGMRADQAFDRDRPALDRLARRGASFRSHRGVFPSATRASAASIATGCWPRRHGLHGNHMALPAPGGYAVHDVGKPAFRDAMREAFGRTLRVPTMAERAADGGGAVVFSNVSPGAAYFHDPDGWGSVYHRAGSFAPGLAPAPDPLVVTADLAGDVAMTERFCREVLLERRPALAVLWFANPDGAQHAAPLGSPAVEAAIGRVLDCLDRVVDAADRLRDRGDDVLLLAGSDHGHETARATIPVESLLVEAGFKAEPDDPGIVVAPQGTAALVYVAPRRAERADELAAWFARQPWCGRVLGPEALAAAGHAATEGVALAIDMAKDDEPNAFGVPGHSYVASRFEGDDAGGFGQHGGLGPNETRPFLIAVGRGFPEGALVREETALVDLAPTLLAHLGLPADDCDGRTLQSFTEDLHAFERRRAS